MKHTDFYSLHKQLDERAEKELISAVQAHGEEFIFVRENYVCEYCPPIIMASTKYMENYEDFYVSRVKIDENGHCIIYGFLKGGCDEDEQELESIAHGQIEYIIDMIPETETVSDVSASVK